MIRLILAATLLFSSACFAEDMEPIGAIHLFNDMAADIDPDIFAAPMDCGTKVRTVCTAPIGSTALVQSASYPGQERLETLHVWSNLKDPRTAFLSATILMLTFDQDASLAERGRIINELIKPALNGEHPIITHKGVQYEAQAKAGSGLIVIAKPLH